MKTDKRIYTIVIFALCMSGLIRPVYADGWKFKSVSENAALWNGDAGNLGIVKTGSENSVLKMRISGQAGGRDQGNKEKDGEVSDNKADREITDRSRADKAGPDKSRTDVNRIKKEGASDDDRKKTDPDDWRLILVNKQNPIPDDYEAVMVPFRGVSIREEVKAPLDEMFEAASDEGITLSACSGYRTHTHQQELFNRKIRTYTGQGLSYLDAFRIGSYSVIIPGTSEHELGMALDIVTPGHTSLNEGFANTEAGKWLKDNAHKYGFILRYPKGKEYITGIIYEPWHFRYVGEEAAAEIYKDELTLEEYLEELELY